MAVTVVRIGRDRRRHAWGINGLLRVECRWGTVRVGMAGLLPVWVDLGRRTWHVWLLRMCLGLWMLPRPARRHTLR